MTDSLYPQATPAVSARRKELAPEVDAAFAHSTLALDVLGNHEHHA
ncbi:MAG: hypothetical protein ACTMKY_10385 [Dermabacteraceae bacterium]|nr:hypothetical protein [Brachybacterium sp.]